MNTAHDGEHFFRELRVVDVAIWIIQTRLLLSCILRIQITHLVVRLVRLRTTPCFIQSQMVVVTFQLREHWILARILEGIVGLERVLFLLSFLSCWQFCTLAANHVRMVGLLVYCIVRLLFIFARREVYIDLLLIPLGLHLL